jgi:primosomal replication protein N
VHVNSCVLSACIAEVESLRYTPAGLPALNVKLEHESQVSDNGNPRTVKLVMKAIAFGTLAERLAKQAVGSDWKFSGFLSNSRQGKSVVFNIQDFLQD